jgi:Fic family protein
MKTRKIQPLPVNIDLETTEILKKLAEAHRYLAELKGGAATIPNEAILINTLSLQEAKDSSAVENIVTTHDELYKAQSGDPSATPAAKEVERYALALQYGYREVRKSPLITTRLILKLQETLEENDAGFRKLPGTSLKNQATGEVVYTPPQDHAEIVELMSNLERFINDSDLSSLDPLIKLALIHFQFESIHPFYDGNGRTGRIINVLYLLVNDLLHIPVLYLSRYIIQNKSDYYRLLQAVRDEDAWQEWVLFMLDAVACTSRQTLALILGIKELMLQTKHKLRSGFPRIYSQDLINNLFRHPYTKISFLQQDLRVSRLTASRYLDKLVEAGYLEKNRVGRSNYYVNKPLVALLSNIPELS